MSIAGTRNVMCLANGQSVITIDQIITPATSNYVTGDAIGTAAAASTLLTFTNAISDTNAGGSATLIQAEIIEYASTLAKNAVDLVIVSNNGYTTAADNAQFDVNTLSPISANKLCGVIPFATGDYVTVGSTSTGTNDLAVATWGGFSGRSLKVFNSNAGYDVYGYLIYRGASQFAASAQVCVRLTFQRD